ncbi:hypothetical protein LO762_05315 [Actinocorallia sp. API 0066]|uniref:hypothetical protein n=1 Tax=Actinocorallia sp. API 0066 TaxID=2896846 RepID=UPI001E55301A|nr:hypothetical protein [Actinocorallia sp. API 0066]MCD0448616.1 hypothetical protein [Actinocorallia sp. API 0066]
MNIETALQKLIEHAEEELHIRRHRDQEKTNRADHGHDEAELLTSARKLDEYAHEVLKIHETQLPRR